MDLLFSLFQSPCYWPSKHLKLTNEKFSKYYKQLILPQQSTDLPDRALIFGIANVLKFGTNFTFCYKRNYVPPTKGAEGGGILVLVQILSASASYLRSFNQLCALSSIPLDGF